MTSHHGPAAPASLSTPDQTASAPDAQDARGQANRAPAAGVARHGAGSTVEGIQAEMAPNGYTVRLAVAMATPEETYAAAKALGKLVFPRETEVDAVRRLHGLSHQQALDLGTAHFRGPVVDAAFYRGQERLLGLEVE